MCNKMNNICAYLAMYAFTVRRTADNVTTSCTEMPLIMNVEKALQEAAWRVLSRFLYKVSLVLGVAWRKRLLECVDEMIEAKLSDTTYDVSSEPFCIIPLIPDSVVINTVPVIKLITLRPFSIASVTRWSFWILEAAALLLADIPVMNGTGDCTKSIIFSGRSGMKVLDHWYGRSKSSSTHAHADTLMEHSPRIKTLLSINSSLSTERKLFGAIRWSNIERPQWLDTSGNGRWILVLSTNWNSGILISNVGVALEMISKSFFGWVTWDWVLFKNNLCLWQKMGNYGKRMKYGVGTMDHIKWPYWLGCLKKLVPIPVLMLCLQWNDK